MQSEQIGNEKRACGQRSAPIGGENAILSGITRRYRADHAIQKLDRRDHFDRKAAYPSRVMPAGVGLELLYRLTGLDVVACA
jgi:hypothetical protein